MSLITLWVSHASCLERPLKLCLFVFQQLRVRGWMEGDDFNTEAVMNICGEYASAPAFMFLKDHVRV